MPRILSEMEIAGFREKLCAVATRIVVEHGHEGFNMRLLASRMGISAMTPYRYFKDKDEILSAIRARAFDHFADQLEAALAKPGSAADRGAALAKAYVRFALEEQVCYRLMFDLAQAPGAAQVPELAAAEKRARAAITDPVRGLVADGAYKGDADMIGHVFWAALHGAVVLHLAGKLDGAVNFEALLAEVTAMLRQMYKT